MPNFTDKFNDPRWRRRRDEILRRANHECESCREPAPDLQVHICYYVKGKEPWELPDSAYKCYCPSDRQSRQNVESDIRIMLATFEISELDSLHEAMKQLAEIPGGNRAVSAERVYIAAKRERYRPEAAIDIDDEDY